MLPILERETIISLINLITIIECAHSGLDLLVDVPDVLLVYQCLLCAVWWLAVEDAPNLASIGQEVCGDER